MKVIIAMIKRMGKVYSLGRVETYIEEIIKMMKEKGMVR
jgi:hypothetical protein